MRKLMSWTMAAAMGVFLALPARAGDLEGTVTIPEDKLRGLTFKKGKQLDKAGYEGDRSAEHRPTSNELECVVVTLESEELKATPVTFKGPDNTIIQKEWQFRPHVVAVPKGSKVYFRNEDPFVHRVYAASGPAHFDFKGFKGERPVEFESPGAVEIFCGIHTNMNCYVVVTPNDFFSRTDGKGGYSIKNIPPGTYKLKVWHPRLEPFEKSVTIPKTGATKLDLSF